MAVRGPVLLAETFLINFFTKSTITCGAICLFGQGFRGCPHSAKGSRLLITLGRKAERYYWLGVVGSILNLVHINHLGDVPPTKNGFGSSCRDALAGVGSLSILTGGGSYAGHQLKGKTIQAAPGQWRDSRGGDHCREGQAR